MLSLEGKNFKVIFLRLWYFYFKYCVKVLEKRILGIGF